jgi:hypothetical protein
MLPLRSLKLNDHFMKLLKIISVLFAIHFIRRFYHMYQALKAAQNQAAQEPPKTNKHVDQSIEADYKRID